MAGVSGKKGRVHLRISEKIYGAICEEIKEWESLNHKKETAI